MSTMNVSLRNVPGTTAAKGWAGGHTGVIDRPDGRGGVNHLGPALPELLQGLEKEPQLTIPVRYANGARPTEAAPVQAALA